MKDILQILRYSAKFWRFYLSITLLIVLISILNLVNPVINKNLVDYIVGNINGENDGELNFIIYLLILYFVIDVIVTILTNFSGYLGDRLAQRLNTFLTQKFYRKVLNLHIQYFDNEVSGKISNKLQRGITSITGFINQSLNSFLPFFLTAFFTIIFLAFYSIEIAVLLAILFPIYIIISDRSSKLWIKRQNEINIIEDVAFGRVLEVISSIRVVKSYLMQKLEYGTFSKKRKEIEDLTKIQSRGYHSFDFLRRIILNIIFFLIYAYIIYNTYESRYTIGEMTLMLQLVNQARFPLFAMSFILNQIQQAQAGSKEFFDVLKTQVKIKDPKRPKRVRSLVGNVEFKNVFFAYEHDNYVLKDISFSLKKGEKLAIVGQSGEGKSTLINLLLRFYTPQKGKILVDGVGINTIKQRDLHEHVSIVMQDTFLFSGTLYENIAYGKINSNKQDVISAARKANAEEFIEKFKDKYNTQVGERGIKLSGGQKQRISIARAILKNSPILVLDEATSSLDSKSEGEVQKALEELMKNKTSIIIAHRLSTIKNVDKIIVLKDGKIAEKGSPSELIKKHGIYANLVKLQKEALEAEKTVMENQKKLKEYNIN